MATVEKKIIIAAPAIEIWNLAVDSSRWHTWFEGLSEAKSIEGDGGVGTVIDHTITVYNIPMPLKTTVVTFDPGVFWKSEFSGPMNKGTQQWLYEPTGGGTAITFTIEVEFSGPAKLAEKMVVSAFGKMADKTLANIKEMTES